MSGAKANFSGGEAAGWRARFPACGWPECTCTPATGCRARAAESASEERARVAAIKAALESLPTAQLPLGAAILAERLPASPNFLHG